MIVELFGPPCSGKTVVATQLARRLRLSGLPVQLHVSSRGDPVDESSGDVIDDAPLPQFAALDRLWRPMREFASQGPGSRRAADVASEVAPLLQLVADKPSMATFRFRRYVARLAQIWRAAERSEAISLFDQGYTQAVCSALLLNSDVSDAALAQVLLSLPRPDFLIRVDAPGDVVEERLRRRMSHLGVVGRLLEVSMGIDVARLSNHVASIERLGESLVEAGRPVYTTRSQDPAALDAWCARIAAEWSSREVRPRQQA